MPSAKQVAQSQQTTVGAVTTEQTIVTANPLSRRNLTGLVITTVNAAVCNSTLRDGTGGLIRAVWTYPNAATAPSSPFVVNFDPPLQQSSINSNWTIQASASVTAYNVTAMFVDEA